MTTVSEILDQLKSVEPSTHYPDAIIDAVGLDYSAINYDLEDNPFTEKYFKTWICTDTRVGHSVIYFNGNPIAFCEQSARKSPKHIVWYVQDYQEDKTGPIELVRKWAHDNYDYWHVVDEVVDQNTVIDFKFD